MRRRRISRLFDCPSFLSARELSCGGESIITEEGPDPTEFSEWVEGLGEPGDKGMSMSAAGGACESPCNGSTDGGVCEGLPSS